MQKIINLFKSIFVYNKLAIFNFYGVYRDFSNLFYSGKCFKDFSRTDIYLDNKGRLDWLNHPYFVLNLDEEFFKLTEPAQFNLMVNRYAPIFNVLTEYAIFDITTFKIKRIKLDSKYTNSILIYFRPVFYYTSVKNLLLSLIFYYFLINYYSKDIIIWLKMLAS